MTRSLVLVLAVAAACKPKADHDRTCRRYTDLVARCDGESDAERERWFARCQQMFEPDFGQRTAEEAAIYAPLGSEMRSLALCAADASDCDALQRCEQKLDREREQRARD